MRDDEYGDLLGTSTVVDPFKNYSKPIKPKTSSVGTVGGSMVNGAYQDTFSKNVSNMSIPEAKTFYSGLAAEGRVAPAGSTTSGAGGMFDFLGDEGFMSGALGVGELGLGLANYFAMKPLYKEQLKGLKQNRQFAAADQATQDAARTGFKNISIKGVPDQAVLQANKAKAAAAAMSKQQAEQVAVV